VKITIVAEENPIARWILRWLRDESTGVESFRAWMRRAGIVLAVYTARELSWSEARVHTPLGVDSIELEPSPEPLIVGVLGASLPLLEGFTELYPSAPIGLLAARRVEEGSSVRIELYYTRLPEKVKGPAVIVDPMLATGYTIANTARILSERGAKPIIAASAIASKPGVSYLASTGLLDSIVTLALDPSLDSRYFIVPGLGDAGDRSLGVEPR
jgi:uracil phosphoribosyltransferase